MKKLLSAALALVMMFSLFSVGVQTAWADAPAEIPAGQVFAGYYTDDTYTTPSATEMDYPKFVDEDAMKVKYQFIPETNEDSTKTTLRVVTTVDSLNYKAVGLHMWIDGEQMDNEVRKFETTKVAGKITGTPDGIEELNYTPQEFSKDSRYFFAFNFTFKNASFTKSLKFQPYWVRQDGTEVTSTKTDGGEYAAGARTFKISQSEYFNNYLIGSASKLYAFATASQTKNFEGWKIKLTQDIDLTENSGWTATVGGGTGGTAPTMWTPIGSEAKPFAGTFDGQGYTISGVYLNTTTARQGLFGQTASTAVLKNFRLTNSYLTTNTVRLGSIVGSFQGVAENIYSDAIVVSTGGNGIGGLFGRVDGNDSTVSQCWYNGTVSTSSIDYVGGLIGTVQVASGVTVEHSLFTGSVNGRTTGGLIGHTNVSITIDDCASLGAVTGTLAYSGTLVGAKGSAATVTVSNTAYGNNRDNTSYKAIQNAAATGTNLVALANQAEITALAGIGGIKGLGSCLDFANYWTIRETGAPAPICFGGDTTYTVDSAADFADVAAASRKFNFANWSILLGAKIDLNPGCVANASGMSGSPTSWTPIGSTDKPFAGTFDGQGNTISGLYLSGAGVPQGLFAATTADATIRDFRLENSYLIATSARMGSIAGNFAGTAERIYSNAFVKYDKTTYIRFGGLFGAVVGAATISECWYDGAVSSAHEVVGGLAGVILAETGTVRLEHNLVTGSVNGKNKVGGLIGYVQTAAAVTIHDCASLGNITSTGSPIGRLVGENNGVSLTITHSVGYHATQATKTVGTGSATATDTANYTATTPAQLTGLNGLKMNAYLDFDHWALREDDVPVPAHFGGGSKTYTISTAEGLLAFAAESQSNNFSGWTIKLGDDIPVNTGTVSDWQSSSFAGLTAWTPIGCEATPFAGTFDGQGHTVSGVYLTATTARQGFFAETAATAVVRDFRIENSYLTTDAARLGSIVGNFAGKAERIYSNAIVKNTSSSLSRHGGLFGAVVGAATISECWYEGTISSANSNVGGIAGVVQNTGEAVTIQHTLFSGTITAESQTGGLLGSVISGSGIVTISDSASLGTVNSITSTSGWLVGENAATSDKLNVTHTVSANEGTATANVGRGSFTYDSYTRKLTEKPSQLKGISGSLLSEYLDFEENWTLRESGVPVPAYFGGGTDTTYTISFAEDLIAFAAVSQKFNFSGWTIKLGDDIPVNTGTVSDWQSSSFAGLTAWTPIGSNSVPFAGTFDGQGNTISGVYLSADTAIQGLFGRTADSSVIKNFRLENSYFTSTNLRVGSIVGDGAGALYNTYSDATVTGNGWAGGLVGLARGLTVENSWFAGTVTSTNASQQGTGGIIAIAYQGNNVVRSCYNSGTINVEQYTADECPRVGGIVGYVSQSGTTMVIDDCLNTGEIVKSEDHTTGFGRVLGYQGSNTSVTTSNSYGTNESCDGTEGNNHTGNPTITLVAANNIKGNNAQTNMPLLDWLNSWQTVADAFPELNFTAGTGSSGVDTTATQSDLDQLDAAYGARTLAFGDMHAHADSDGALDETAALQNWQDHISDYGLDFIASLDHYQTDHIDNDAWDEDIFVYGTEPGTHIYEGLTAPLNSGSIHTYGICHYLMIMPDKASLENVLESVPKFQYDDSHQGNGAFEMAKFTKTEFIALAGAVKAQGGLFVFAHPYAEITPYSSAAEDYFIADGTGFEVVYGSLSNEKTLEHYKLWKQLLANGHKLWITSGSDIHGNLDTQNPTDKPMKALVSVYATAKNSTAYMAELVRGNFSAGSVGIKMCIGNTPMGGTVDFNGQRLVIEVGGFHQYVSYDTRAYRLDVYSDQGIVYSQRISNQNNAPIALDVDENCRFYRVEIVDQNNAQTISYGNPIWNN